MRSAIVNHLYFFDGWATITLLVGRVVMPTGVGKLHHDSGGAGVKMLRQEVVPSFGAGQTTAVGIRLLVNGTT